MRKFIALLITMFCTVCLSQMVFATAFGTTVDTGTDKPQVTLVSCKVISGEITTDGTAELLFTFLNNSDSVSVKDMTVNFDSKDLDIYPTYGKSSQLYVGSIEPGKTTEKTKSFKISNDTNKMVSLHLTMQYTAQTAPYDTYGTVCDLYLPVLDTSGFNTQVIIPSTTQTNTLVKITGIVGNSSDQTFKNLTLHMLGDFDGKKKELTLGDLDIGKQSSFNSTVSFPKSGVSKSVSIYFTFVDDNGSNIKTEPTSYAVSVTNPKSPNADSTGFVLHNFLAMFSSTDVLILSGMAFIILVMLSIAIRLFRKYK